MHGCLVCEDFIAYGTGHNSSVQGRGCMGTMVLYAAALAVLMVVGGVEQNPGPSAEAESIMQVLCSGCDRNLKSETQCDVCGRWFYSSCGNFETQVAVSGKWVCDRCRWEKVHLLKEKLQNALLDIEV